MPHLFCRSWISWVPLKVLTRRSKKILLRGKPSCFRRPGRAPETLRCPSCGAEIIAGKKFCADCGNGFKMKRIAILLSLFWLAVPGLPRYSQQKGIVEGRLVNGTDPSIIARSVELDVVELGAGMSIIKTATTDSSGKFRVDGLPESRAADDSCHIQRCELSPPVQHGC